MNKIDEIFKAINDDDIEAIKILLRGNNFDISDENGNTPLHWAVMNERKEIVALLMKHNVNTTAENNDGKTPLHYAIAKRNLEILKLL